MHYNLRTKSCNGIFHPDDRLADKVLSEQVDALFDSCQRTSRYWVVIRANNDLVSANQ